MDLILATSLVREADRVRVTAQLIDAGGDHHLWAKSYDRAVFDVLSLQAEVATTIAKDVNLTISTRFTLP